MCFILSSFHMTLFQGVAFGMPLLPAREAAPGAAEAREDLRHAAEFGRVCAHRNL